MTDKRLPMNHAIVEKAKKYLAWCLEQKEITLANGDIPFQPNSIPQAMALQSPARMIIMGGSTGGGKTRYLEMALGKYSSTPNFSGALFRRVSREINQPGGLAETTKKIYSHLNKGDYNISEKKWTFGSDVAKKNGSAPTIHLSGIEADRDLPSIDGLQASIAGFDELQTFTERMWWYVFARLRNSDCYVYNEYTKQRERLVSKMLGTCNPDPDSFLAKLIDWWIGEDGLIIKERSGVIRWLQRHPVTLSYIWADTEEELNEELAMIYKEIGKTGRPPRGISLTFIRSELSDNVDLSDEYKDNVSMIGDEEDRARKLEGNWKFRAHKGTVFNSKWIVNMDDANPDNHRNNMIRYEDLPSGMTACAGWDLAATTLEENKNADGSCCVLIARDRDSNFYVMDCQHMHKSSPDVQDMIKLLGKEYLDDEKIDELVISIPQDPGQSGKDQAKRIKQEFYQFDVHSSLEEKEKTIRFKPFARSAYNGKVFVVYGDWNEAYFNELNAFAPKVKKDDRADATSRAFAIVAEIEVFQNVWDMM